jgi:RimJ/RimL family protein N-acetyltransferase
VIITIRTATLEDVEALRDYAGRLFAEHLPGIFRRDTPTIEQELEYLGSYLEPENATILVAEREGGIVGMLGFMGEKLAEEAHSGTLGVSVDAEARGTGIGTNLIEALIDWAPAHGITRIQLLAWANNPGSIRLYERLGFEREGVLRRAIITDGEPVDVLLLARLLD